MRPLAILGLCALLAGCASGGGRVALLNDEAGGAGAVAVLDPATGTARGELNQANTQADLGDRRARARPLTTNYDALLSAMPSPPKVFTLYFADGTRLTPESTQTLEELRRLITPASEVQITGHTDTTGDTISNDKLSLDRAIEVRSALVQQGLPVANARVTGRGERELFKPTADGVAEPANRRVQVIIR